MALNRKAEWVITFPVWIFKGCFEEEMQLDLVYEDLRELLNRDHDSLRNPDRRLGLTLTETSTLRDFKRTMGELADSYFNDGPLAAKHRGKCYVRDCEVMTDVGAKLLFPSSSDSDLSALIFVATPHELGDEVEAITFREADSRALDHFDQQYLWAAGHGDCIFFPSSLKADFSRLQSEQFMSESVNLPAGRANCLRWLVISASFGRLCTEGISSPLGSEFHFD